MESVSECLRQEPTVYRDLVERDEWIVSLRSQGMTFKWIGEHLGISRQRVMQLWESATASSAGEAQCQPEHCWCGAKLPPRMGPGRPQRYCSAEHKPKPKPTYVPKPPKPRKRRTYAACGDCGVVYGERSPNSFCDTCRVATRHRRMSYYADLFEAQGGVCAICGSPETTVDRRTGKIRKLSVDHCHETGSIRGLLCMKCNTMLGAVQDNTDVLESAITYLRRHQLSVVEAA